MPSRLPPKQDSRLILCPNYNLRTGHVWRQREQYPLLARALNRAIAPMGGWACSDCGHQTTRERIKPRHDSSP